MGKRQIIRGVLFTATIVCVAHAIALPAAAQLRPGPVPPPTDAPPTVVISATPKPAPPPVPVNDIIHRFTQNEDAMFAAHDRYLYKRTIRVQELDNSGKVTGELVISTEIARGADGRYFEKGEKHPDSTLKHLDIDYEHMTTLDKIPLLPFTTAQAAKYDFVYEGTQKLDELNTYIFRVQPKQVDRQHAYFDGVIWVDDQDFVIVKTLGRWETELGDVATDQFPFKIFDTYRENVEGKMWFPDYVRSDETIKTKTGTVNVRLTVRWDDYKSITAATQTSRQLSGRPRTPSHDVRGNPDFSDSRSARFSAAPIPAWL